MPDEQERAATVARIEARVLASAASGDLAAACARVSARFSADLDDLRDVLLSRGGALMLLQELLGQAGQAQASPPFPLPEAPLLSPPPRIMEDER